MFRNCAVAVFFAARMIVPVFDLESPEPPAGLAVNTPVKQEATDELPPTIISGLPEDGGTLRR